MSTTNVTEEVERLLDGLEPSELTAKDATHFRRIISARERMAQASAELHDAVKAARAAGDSWVAIGAALGVSKQAAQKRFGRDSADQPQSDGGRIESEQRVLGYAPHADKAVLDKMAATYRLVLSNRDSALVSASDPEELATVRENFLKKKLGLTQSDAELDKAIKDVMDQMKDGKPNPRLAVYYLLAEKFNKLDVFKS